jgi:glycerol uptake facilitator-like aquaporin
LRFDLRRRLASETLGSIFLALAVIGSGIMAERVASGNVAVALLAVTGATVCTLIVLIALLGPVSGAHLNPVVSVMLGFRRLHPWSEVVTYALCQTAGACGGALLAHFLFSQADFATY